jgi:hypothetical protein
MIGPGGLAAAGQLGEDVRNAPRACEAQRSGTRHPKEGDREMRRLSVMVGILGLAWAAVLPAGAQKTVKLFGKTYNVDCQSRAQTYKNGLKVTLPDSGNKKANLFFVEGADPSKDRLFVAAPITSDDAVTGDQVYLLTGADANGNFSPASATLTQFFGGNQNRQRGGRPVAIMLINDVNTGVHMDRNVIMMTFWNQDNYRLYDLDTMNEVAGDNDDGKPSDAVFSRPKRQEDDTVGDPNAPWGAFLAFAPMAKHDGKTVVAFGQPSDAGMVEVGVWDTTKNDAFPILTNLNNVTANATTPFPQGFTVHGAFRYAEGDNEYWLLVSSSPPDGDSDDTEMNRIYRLRLTFPADLSKAKPGDIKAEVLGMEELKGTALGGASAGGMFGMAVGREVAPGLRRLYFADWAGNLCVATPVP